MNTILLGSHAFNKVACACLQYPSFFQQHPGKNSLASYLTDLLASPSSPAYLSATEVGILRLIGPTARRSRTSLILKVLDPNTVEQSTNTTYGTLLQNLLEIRTYASGILVPKNLIWPINDKTQYLQAHTNLVEDAHKAKLAVYAYDFANDQYPNSFNYSFDPIAEYLAYVGQADFSVDGVLTDFPSTASEAISRGFLCSCCARTYSYHQLFSLISVGLYGFLYNEEMCKVSMTDHFVLSQIAIQLATNYLLQAKVHNKAQCWQLVNLLRFSTELSYHLQCFLPFTCFLT